MPVPIAGAGFILESGEQIVPLTWTWWSTALPASADPHASCSFQYPMRALLNEMKNHGIDELQAFVLTGTGRKLITDRDPVTAEYLERMVAEP